MHFDPDLVVICFTILVGGISFPLVRAFVRRLDRGAPAASLQSSAEVVGRLAAIETAVEAIAVEVERISENQRFTTKLLAGREAAGVSVATPERQGA